MARDLRQLRRPHARHPHPVIALGAGVRDALVALGVKPGEPFLVMAPEPEQARARRTDPKTSHQAAASIDDLPKRERDVLDIFHLFTGPMTDENLVMKYDARTRSPGAGMRRQSPSGIRSRRAELVAQGFLRDSKRKGKTRSGRSAILWELTPRGGGR